MFPLVASETHTSRGNDGSSASTLSPDRIGVFIPPVRDAAGGASLLGISICPDRGGKITQFGENYGVLHQSQKPVSRFHLSLCSDPEVFRGDSFFLVFGFAPVLGP